MHKWKETRFLLSGSINESAAYAYFSHAASIILDEVSRLAKGRTHVPEALDEVCGALAQMQSTGLDLAHNRAFRQCYFLQRDQLDFRALTRADWTLNENYELFSSASAASIAVDKALRDGASAAARKIREEKVVAAAAAAAPSSVPASSTDHRSDGGSRSGQQRDSSTRSHRSSRRSRSRSP